MREVFFLGVIGVGIISALVYFLWSIVAALYHDWTLGRGVGQLEAESQSLREQRQQRATERLNNGCEHEFGNAFGGFPPNACRKCGLEQTRPSGSCDHVWRFANEAVPCSYCEKCGKRYVGRTSKELI